ncbi:MAG: DoxX family protein [Blastocatellia bacterium]
MISKFYPDFPGGWRAAALLLVRVVMGAAFLLHGWPKMQNPTGWMNVMGLAPVPAVVQALAVLIEVGGGIALILGLLTPLASIGIICQMAAALLIVHLPNGDPFVAPGRSSFELALIYLSLAVLLLVIGPGRFSLDYLLFGRGSQGWHGRTIVREV